MCVSVCEYVHICRGAQGGQKKVSNPLKSELQVVVSP